MDLNILTEQIRIPNNRSVGWRNQKCVLRPQFAFRKQLFSLQGTGLNIVIMLPLCVY